MLVEILTKSRNGGARGIGLSSPDQRIKVALDRTRAVIARGRNADAIAQFQVFTDDLIRTRWDRRIRAEVAIMNDQHGAVLVVDGGVGQRGALPVGLIVSEPAIGEADETIRGKHAGSPRISGVIDGTRPVPDEHAVGEVVRFRIGGLALADA